MFKSQNILFIKNKKIFKLHNGKFELDLSYFQFYFFDRKKFFLPKNLKSCLENLGKKIKKIEKRHYEIASAMQKAFEEDRILPLKNLKSKGGKSGNIALAGGAAMNCVFNGLLHENNLYKKLYSCLSR